MFAVRNSLLRDILGIRHGNRHGKAKEGSKDGNGQLHCIIAKLKTREYENITVKSERSFLCDGETTIKKWDIMAVL